MAEGFATIAEILPPPNQPLLKAEGIESILARNKMKVWIGNGSFLEANSVIFQSTKHAFQQKFLFSILFK